MAIVRVRGGLWLPVKDQTSISCCFLSILCGISELPGKARGIHVSELPLNWVDDPKSYVLASPILKASRSKNLRQNKQGEK